MTKVLAGTKILSGAAGRVLCFANCYYPEDHDSRSCSGKIAPSLIDLLYSNALLSIRVDVDFLGCNQVSAICRGEV